MTTAHSPQSTEEAIVYRIAEARDRIKRELAKVIRGQDDVIEQLLIAQAWPSRPPPRPPIGTHGHFSKHVAAPVSIY